MEGESATLEIDTGDVTYVLPAFEFGIEEVAGELGATSLEDIEITVSIDAASHDGAEFIADAADENGFTVVLQPVSFTVTAEYNGRTVEISQFENYVQRMVEIPDYVSPDRVTTAIVVGEDGTVRHVPTEVVEVDGVYYAVINSLTQQHIRAGNELGCLLGRLRPLGGGRDQQHGLQNGRNRRRR